MDFKTDKPIYRQIVDYCFACILTRKWLPGEKVPSVREMALQMAVNTHTVIKAFDFLQDAGVIYPKEEWGSFWPTMQNRRLTAYAANNSFPRPSTTFFPKWICSA